MEFSKHLSFKISNPNEEFKINLPTNINADNLTLNISNDSRYKLFIQFNNQTFYTINSLTDISYTVPLVFGTEFIIKTELQLETSYIATDIVNINISTASERLNLNYMSIDTYNYMTEETYIYTRSFSQDTTHYIIQNGIIDNRKIKRIKYLYFSLSGASTTTGKATYTLDNNQISLVVSSGNNTITHDFIEINTSMYISNLKLQLSGQHTNDKTIIIYS